VKNNLQRVEKCNKNVPIEGIAKVDDNFNYNSRRNNMDFGMCFVVVLVMLLFIVAWIDDQRTKEEEMPGLQRGGQPFFFYNVAMPLVMIFTMSIMIVV
jgi:hypothetical protein